MRAPEDAGEPDVQHLLPVGGHLSHLSVNSLLPSEGRLAHDGGWYAEPLVLTYVLL